MPWSEGASIIPVARPGSFAYQTSAQVLGTKIGELALSFAHPALCFDITLSPSFLSLMVLSVFLLSLAYHSCFLFLFL